MNQNFNLAKELAEQSEKDWKFGSGSKYGIVSIPLAERAQWLPVGELQFDQFGDYMDCASRSPVNQSAALFTYHYQHEMKSENKKWLENNGYVNDGKVDFSDRYISILSGTTKEGNSLKAPLEAIRTKGLIPKSMLPAGNNLTWEHYMDPASITQDMLDMGSDFKDRFPMNYEQVAREHFPIVLQDDMIGVAGYAWPEPKNGVYPATDGTFNHAFLIYALPQWQIFDNYYDYDDTVNRKTEGDFTKNLAPDYKFFDYGYRVYIAAEYVNPNEKKISILKQLVVLYEALIAAIFANKKKVELPIQLPINIPPAMPSNLKIADVATSLLNTDASPKNLAPQELACAESVSNILHAVFPDFPENIIGTDALFAELKRSPHFKSVLDPQIGTIVVSPRTPMKNGHAGIYVAADSIASNDSSDGLFKENYDRASWRRTFIAGRGLKGYLFDAV